jgi:hypothetical protein
MAMAGANTQPMAALFATRAAISTPDALAAVSLPMVRTASPAMIGIKRTPLFQTLTVYQFPVHAIKPVRTNVFPPANYIGPSVRYRLNLGAFAAPNYIAPSVRFHIAPASFPLPNFVAPSVRFHATPAGFADPNYIDPSVKFQVASAGFTAPNYVSPSMNLQLEAAEFPVPVLTEGGK